MTFDDFKLRLRGAWHSATIWFNSIAAVAVVSLPIAQESFPQMEAYLSHRLYHAAMGFLIVANILLRIKTTASLAQKGQQ